MTKDLSTSTSNLGVSTTPTVDIIDNIVGIETKVYQACVKDMKLSEVKRRIRTKKRHSKYIKKDEKKQLEELFFEGEWSGPMTEIVEKFGDDMMKYGKEIKAIVGKGVKFRSRSWSRLEIDCLIVI